MENVFRRFKLPASSRMMISAFFWTLCVGVQIGLDAPLLGMLLAIPPWFILSLKPLTNRPADLGKEEWRAVGEAEIMKVADYLKESKRLDQKIGGSSGLKALILLVCTVIGVIQFFGDNFGPAVLFFDALLFLIPGFFSGHVNIFIPDLFNLKMQGFMAIMNAPRSPDLILTPYLRFDKDKEKRDIPEDMRFMLEPRRKPKDLIGIQFQMSINNGQYGRVPYLYAVAITKGKSGPAYEALSKMTAKGYHVEPGGDKEYGTVVVRQFTTGTGYHTKNADCVRLFNVMTEALEKI